MGVAKCTDFPTHNDVQHVTGTDVLLTGLSSATRYHIHVHRLPLTMGGVATETVFIRTLPAGSGPQPVVAADYERCKSPQ